MNITQAIELVNGLETEVLGLHFFSSRSGEAILVERSIKQKFKNTIDKLSAIVEQNGEQKEENPLGSENIPEINFLQHGIASMSGRYTVTIQDNKPDISTEEKTASTEQEETEFIAGYELL